MQVADSKGVTEGSVPVSLIIYDGSLTSLEEGSYQKLRDSIKEDGLLHPITIKRFDVTRFKLISGRSRLRAIKDLGQEKIRALILPESISKERAQELHLKENLRRYSLPWYEEVQLEAELHELRVKKHGEKVTGRPRISSKEQGWSQTDTARELGISIGALSQDLSIADALRLNPGLRKVKDKTTALKLIRQMVKREENFEESLIPPNIEMNQVYLGDSASVLKSLPDRIFDVCITDPPWLEYKDDSLIRDDDTLPVFSEVYRTLKTDGLLYMFVSTQDFHFYLSKLPEVGFKVQKYPLIWVKGNTITHGRRSWEYARDFEPILLAAKGSPVLTSPQELSAIFEYNVVPPVKLIHPHEKPIDLIKRILEQSTWEGGKVLDPFAGSGVTLQASREMDRYYIGIEREKRFYDNIVNRLGENNKC